MLLTLKPLSTRGLGIKKEYQFLDTLLSGRQDMNEIVNQYVMTLKYGFIDYLVMET